MSLYYILLSLYDSAQRVEPHGLVAEQPFDITAPAHLLCWHTMKSGGVYEGYSVAQGEGYVEFVGGKQDALSFVMGQPGEQRTEFVTVGHVEERGRLVQQDDGCGLCQCAAP